MSELFKIVKIAVAGVDYGRVAAVGYYVVCVKSCLKRLLYGIADGILIARYLIVCQRYAEAVLHKAVAPCDGCVYHVAVLFVDRHFVTYKIGVAADKSHRLALVRKLGRQSVGDRLAFRRGRVGGVRRGGRCAVGRLSAGIFGT